MAEQERWEYREYKQGLELMPDVGSGEGVEFLDKATGKVNEVGQDGWALVAVFSVASHQIVMADGSGLIQRPIVCQYIFKRRVQQETNET